MNYTLFSFLILAIVLQSVPVGFIGVAENGESGNGNGLYSSEGVYLLCEEMERRGAFEKHFITSDGKFIAVSYPEQIHYVDEEEHFIDVDCSLKAEEETLIAKTGDYMTAFLNLYSGVPVINKSPSIAIWSSPEDFVYSHDSGPIGIVSIDSTCVFEGQNIGIATYKAVHKITNLTYFFTVYVDRYTYELVNSFGFSANVSVLIRGLYSRIDSVLSSESMDYKAWHVARLLSEFSYDNTTYYFGVIGIDKWDDVAGSVTSPSNRKGYFTNTLNYTEEEYNSINTAPSRHSISRHIKMMVRKSWD